MAKVALAFHSAAGHTEAIARSIVRGLASVSGVRAEMVNVAELPERGRSAPPAESGWAKLDNADAIIFGTPTHMGSVSAAFKSFMDQTGSVWFSQLWKDKLAAGFTVSQGLDGDKAMCLHALVTFACQHSMVWVSQGIFSDESGINRLSTWTGMAAVADNAPAEQTPPAQDHQTAQAFGERIGLAAVRWVKGSERSGGGRGSA